MSDVMYTDIPMTKANKLAILKEARTILSDEKAWTQGELKDISPEGKPQWCVLGAIEQATYTLRLATENDYSFAGEEAEEGAIDAYALGRDISIFDYSNRVFNRAPEDVNDSLGYDKAM